jgi:ATP-dependent Clp protease adaptor protein ClpS
MTPAMAKDGTERESGVATRTRPAQRLAKPRLYKVLLHNDDYTTMEFVVWVLQTVFHHDEAAAAGIMLHVHKNGVGVAGIYSREIAETRAGRVEELARQYEFPLRSSIEEEEV